MDDIRRRRLKVARLEELNDPFELLGADLRHPALRYAVVAAKSEFARVRGFLCFSLDWHNPVQWSHYASKHQGLCLGFEVPDDDCVRPITYSAKRFIVDVERLLNMTTPDPVLFARFLFTKYAHWRYEKEVRAIVSLKESENGLYFSEFNDELQLACVIVGARSKVTRDMLRAALGNLAPQVEVFKARLAFRTFKVVRQRNPGLWA
ncbi:MAG TPA: DUF2971 domain-containing protein [Thermoanaerobaculia bacterium]|nr:DUF2971 domain-containing protein [Thermoanaerobaculia bacterium]